MLASFAVVWITILSLHRTPELVLQYGDNGAYLAVANAIRHWDFHAVYIQHFMGFPYAIAGVSMLTHLPAGFVLWIISVVSAFASVWLVAELFGNIVAAYFALTNLAWLQSAYVGGSEPLAVTLVLGAMLMFRSQRLWLAGLLGSFAVTVRPLMIFVLVGIGLVLLGRRQIKAFLLVLVTALAIGILYTLPLARYLGDPLLTVHSYTRRDYGGGGIAGPHGHLFGWPFHGIVAGTLAYPAPWTNLLVSFFWIALVLAGVVCMFSRDYREYARKHWNEAAFCALYLLAIFSYDYLLWARSNFIRFCIPDLPFVFYALSRFLPTSKRLLWILSIVCAVLAAVSAIGVRNVFGQLSW